MIHLLMIVRFSEYECVREEVAEEEDNKQKLWSLPSADQSGEN